MSESRRQLNNTKTPWPCTAPLGEIEGCHFRLKASDVVQVNSIRAKMAAPLVCSGKTAEIHQLQ